MAQPDRSNHPSRTSEAIDTALALAVETLEATKDTIVDALSVPGVGVALNAAIALLNKVQEAKSNRAALESLREETKFLAQTLVRLGKIVQTAIHEYPAGSEEDKRTREAIAFANLVERTNQLASNLEAVCVEAEKLIKRNRFGRFVHSKGDARRIADMKEKIETDHRHFLIEGSVTTEAKVNAALSDIKRVIAEQKAAEEERILSSIPRADDAHYRSAANAMKARLQEGTREQILALLEEWEEKHVAGRGTHSVFVLVGEAGTGKSTIVSEFAKRLQARKRLGGSFFFTRGAQDLNSPRKFFSTIASQLARSQPALRNPIIDSAREHLKEGSLQQIEHEFHDLVEKPLRSLPPSHSPIFVIVDALDECTEEGPELVPTLLRLLLSYATSTGSLLRVLLTSRPEPHYIHKAFTASDLAPHLAIISIQDFGSSVDRDIETFLRARLSEDPITRSWCDADQSIVSGIVAKADRLFVYARTAVDFIIGDLDALPSIQERYSLLTVEGTVGLAALHLLYRTVLTSVFSLQDQYPHVQKRLRLVLGYLVTLQHPRGISPNTLEILTNMPTTESIPILNKLRSVVFFERDDVNSRFRIIHATFREFLTQSSHSEEVFYISRARVQACHGDLADGCMRTMRAFLDRNWPGYTGAALTLQLLLDHQRKFNDLPHHRYAYRYFDHHREHRVNPLQDPQGSQRHLVIDDDIPPISLTVAYLYRKCDYTMSCLIIPILEHLRDSLPVRQRGMVNALLSVNVFSSEEVHSHRTASVQMDTLFIILDLQTMERYAASARAITQSTYASTRLDNRHFDDLEKSLEEALSIKCRDDKAGLAFGLKKAHIMFHNAIIAVGYTAGHPFEEW